MTYVGITQRFLRTAGRSDLTEAQKATLQSDAVYSRQQYPDDENIQTLCAQVLGDEAEKALDPDDEAEVEDDDEDTSNDYGTRFGFSPN